MFPDTLLYSLEHSAAAAASSASAGLRGKNQ